MPQETKFQPGKTYCARSSCDWDSIYRFEIVSRTAKTVRIKDECGRIFRCGIHLYEGVEKIRPLGRYSMAPVLSADRVGGAGVMEIQSPQRADSVHSSPARHDRGADHPGTGFTPGPWKLIVNTLRYRIATDDAEETEIVTWDAISPRMPVAAAEEKANAHLIAAAPSMYSLIERVAVLFDGADSPLGTEARSIMEAVNGSA